jgi:hypothetical protein
MHNYLAADDVGGKVLAGVLYLFLIIAYWVPTIIAFARHVPAKAQVVIVNFFLGWTLIGWVVALVMAFRQVPPTGEAR